MNYANDAVNNELVHRTIAQATERAHELMEDCLTSILEIEGWDKASLAMSEALKKNPQRIFERKEFLQ